MFTSEAAKSLYQSPRWGAIDVSKIKSSGANISIPAMGGNKRYITQASLPTSINPRNGGQ